MRFNPVSYLLPGGLHFFRKRSAAVFFFLRVEEKPVKIRAQNPIFQYDVCTVAQGSELCQQCCRIDCSTIFTQVCCVCRAWLNFSLHLSRSLNENYRKMAV